MSKDVSDWKAALKNTAQRQTQEGVGEGMKYISLAGGLMSIGDDIIPNNTLECVILGSVIERSWYDRPYNPDDKSGPDCFAIASFKDNLAPHVDVPSPPCDSCGACPKAEFGTALQGKGPACKTRQRLIVMPTPATPEAVADGDLAMLKVPPTSVTNYTRYIRALGSNTQSFWSVATMIKAAPHPKKQLEVTFTLAKPLPEGIIAAVYARLPEAESEANAPLQVKDPAAA